MKKLNKLQINSEKLMKNDELITLRGGYDDSGYRGYCCYDSNGNHTGDDAGSGLTIKEAILGCNVYYPGSDYAYHC